MMKKKKTLPTCSLSLVDVQYNDSVYHVPPKWAATSDQSCPSAWWLYFIFVLLLAQMKEAAGCLGSD
jgi:hypothetical protein